jgi:hypothetical protein
MVEITTDGVIDTVEVEITVVGEDEHLAQMIERDLVSRADVLNQIVEAGIHPEATQPPTKIDWEGWLHGEYEDAKPSQ